MARRAVVGSGSGLMDVGGEEPAAVLVHAWRLQRVWSQVAGRLKARIDRARNIGLTLGVLGAVLGVLAAQVDGGDDVSRSLAVGAGVAVGLVPLARRGASQEAVRAWTRARSASEGLKSGVYAYLAGGSAYLDGERDQELGDRTREILESVEDLTWATAGVQPDRRAVPAVADIDAYLVERVDGQVERYYRPKAALYSRRLGWLRRIEAALGAAAVVLAVLAGTGGVQVVAPWVAVVSTLAATVAAHAGAARYDHQIVEFERTAARLAQLRATWQIEGWSSAQLIDACEEVISIENQAWMARLTERDVELGTSTLDRPEATT
jgi:hypothetical protein